jgi:hypothetical protein
VISINLKLAEIFEYLDFGFPSSANVGNLGLEIMQLTKLLQYLWKYEIFHWD